MQWEINNRPGEYSRRTIMIGMATATAAVAASMPFSAANAQTDVPRRGGIFRTAIRQGAISDVLDPTRYLSHPQFLMGMASGNLLVELTGDKQPIPELAESWDISPDLKTWTFKIRSSVTFHNGKTLDAEDVVYSLRRHIGEGSTSTGKGLLRGVVDISSDGPMTVVITHETGTPDLHYALANYQFVIVPNGFTDWENFVGTGPYQLKSFNPGVLFEGTRFANYWKPNSAWFDEVHYLFINDDSAAISALMAGEVDAVQDVAAAVVERLKSNKKLAIVQNNGTICTQFDMDCRHESFANPDVRNAIKYLIDRPKMIDFITRGYALPGNDQPIPPTDPFFNPEVKVREYDPEKAKFLLKKAGLDSLSLELRTAELFPGAVDSCSVFQETAKQGGVNIQIKREPVDDYWSNIWLKQPFLLSRAGVRATPDVMFSLFFQSNAAWNETFWKSEQFDKMLLAGRSTTDLAKRKDIYGEMQQLIADGSGAAIFMYPAQIDLYTTQVGGTAPDATRPMMGCRVAERAWFKA